MGPGKFIISLNNLTGARPRVRRRVVCECFDVFHTKKGSGCSGTTGRSADRLPFLVAVPLGDISAWRSVMTGPGRRLSGWFSSSLLLLKGGRGYLMPASCLGSQGCLLIPFRSPLLFFCQVGPLAEYFRLSYNFSASVWSINSPDFCRRYSFYV